MRVIGRIAILTTSLSLAIAIGVAQEHEATTPAQAPQGQAAQGQTPQSQQEAAPQQAEPQKTDAAPSSTQPEKELTGASEAAAGKHEGAAAKEEEEEENSTLKYSPIVTALGKKIGLDPKSSYWLFTSLNFAVLIGAVLWLLKSKVLVAMRNRTTTLRASMETAKKTSEEANARLAAIEGRLSKLDSEVAALKSQAESDFKMEEQRIGEQTKQEAARVVELAEQEIAAAAKAARRELKVYAADLAVGLAEKRISVDRDTDEQLVQSFVNQLGKDGK